MRNSVRLVVVVAGCLRAITPGLDAAYLKPGDLAFVGCQMSGTERFAFVTLVEIPPGTAITLTDNGWNSASNIFRPGENTAVWSNNNSVSIAPCTTVTIEGANASAGRIISGTLSQLNDDGDSIIAYQGPTNARVFLAGINSHAWTTSPPPDTGECNLPGMLSPGVHACMFTNQMANGYYVGALTNASREGLLTAINNQASWVRVKDTLQNWPAWAFAVQTSAPSLAAGDLAVVGFQTSVVNTDRFAFAALRRLPAGAEVAFTDNGWTGTNLTTTKRTVVWQAPAAGVERGSVVRVEGGQASTGTISGRLTLCKGGDQILAFQHTVTNPLFLSAMSTTEWLTNGLPGDHDSYRPAELTNGIAALAFAVNPTNALCPGGIFANTAAIQTWIYTATNWTNSSATQGWPAIWEYRLPQMSTLVRIY